MHISNNTCIILFLIKRISNSVNPSIEGLLHEHACLHAVWTPIGS